MSSSPEDSHSRFPSGYHNNAYNAYNDDHLRPSLTRNTRQYHPTPPPSSFHPSPSLGPHSLPQDDTFSSGSSSARNSPLIDHRRPPSMLYPTNILATATHDMLVDARNSTYLALMQELDNRQSKLDELNNAFDMLKGAYDELKDNHTRLLTDIAQKLDNISGTPSSSSTLAISTRTHTPLTAADFPDPDKVFFTKESWKQYLAAQKAEKGKVGMELAKPRRGRDRAANGENVMCLFVVTKDGKPISAARAGEMRAHARTIFTHLAETTDIKQTWKQSTNVVRAYFAREMENTFEEMRIADNSWKAHELGDVVYPNWRNGHRKRELKLKTDPDAAEDDAIRAMRGGGDEDEEDLDGADMELEVPIPADADEIIENDEPVQPPKKKQRTGKEHAADDAMMSLPSPPPVPPSRPQPHPQQDEEPSQPATGSSAATVPAKSIGGVKFSGLSDDEDDDIVEQSGFGSAAHKRAEFVASTSAKSKGKAKAAPEDSGASKARSAARMSSNAKSALRNVVLFDMQGTGSVKNFVSAPELDKRVAEVKADAVQLALYAPRVAIEEARLNSLKGSAAESQLAAPANPSQQPPAATGSAGTDKKPRRPRKKKLPAAGDGDGTNSGPGPGTAAGLVDACG
ncbi:hypothetical protein MKEN_00931200 [Mycena kentingensis (nom. inval.)]|nr:hypothetical protein MKEN_01131200 [Mycena kentingensis (nom. inval.)]KAF7314578.1 hypothetical protein MKEN_00931200 [Mycena kentingensis (nom. inval.)]